MKIKSFSWAVDGNKAYKIIDKSVIEYNSTGIPKDIRGFWEVENMPDGDKKIITLIVNSKEYHATIEKRDGRTRLLWDVELKTAIDTNRTSMLIMNIGTGKTMSMGVLWQYQDIKDVLIFEKLSSQTYILKRDQIDMNVNRDAEEVSAESEEEEKSYIEGKKKVFYTSRYERKPECRKSALRIHGYRCTVCGFDFEAVYGELGKEYIEVHHKKPLHSLDEEIAVNPETDLSPVCSNCHRMLHRRKDRIVTIEELKSIIGS